MKKQRPDYYKLLADADNETEWLFWLRKVRRIELGRFSSNGTHATEPDMDSCEVTNTCGRLGNYNYAIAPK